MTAKQEQLSDNITLIAAPDLQKFAAALLGAGGFGAAEALQTAESLVLANLMGYDSHGVIRTAEYVACLKRGILTTGAPLSVLSESANSLVADGARRLGQVQMPLFLDRLIEKAAENGVVSGTLRHCGHIGRVGEWAEHLARAGLAGFIFVNDNGAIAAVAPPGGRVGRTSTNPMAFGIPLGDGEMFTLDMSTSAAALGKIRLAYISGTKVEEHLIQDAAGHLTTDPAAIMEEPAGSLLPMGGPAGGYKGFGLSMMVDCLVAGLSGGFAPPAPPETPVLNNVLATIWNPEIFSGAAHFRAEAEKYIAYIRATPPIDPQKPVRVAGDASRAEKARRERNGIPLSRGSCGKLKRLAEKLGVAMPPAIEKGSV